MFRWLKAAGGVPAFEMSRTYNCGIGGALIVEEANVAAVMEQLTQVRSWLGLEFTLTVAFPIIWCGFCVVICSSLPALSPMFGSDVMFIGACDPIWISERSLMIASPGRGILCPDWEHHSY